VFDQGVNEGTSSIEEITLSAAHASQYARPTIDQTTLTFQRESFSMDSSTDVRTETKQSEYNKISPTWTGTTPNSATSMTSVQVCFSDHFLSTTLLFFFNFQPILSSCPKDCNQNVMFELYEICYCNSKSIFK
jgi:hypothetical protein